MISVFRAIARKKLFSTEIVYKRVRMVDWQDGRINGRCPTFLQETISGGVRKTMTRRDIPIYTINAVL